MKRRMCVTSNNLLTHGWQYIPNIITLEEAKNIRDEDYKHIENVDPKFDIDRGNVWWAYAPESTVFVLKRIQPILEDILGEELVPTYWFSTIYQNNCYMLKHMDRTACEISVSLNIHSELDWPLKINDLKGNEAHCYTSIGQGVAYLGPEVEHWRNNLIHPEPTRFVQSFFHYVRKNGDYSGNAYDQNNYPELHERVVRLLGQ